MLRITIHDSPGEFRLRLEGRLAGPWVREVEQCWRTAQSTLRGRALTIDMRDVDYVDPAGEELLAALHAHGAKFLTAGCMIRHLVRKAAAHLKLLAVLLAVASAALPAELPSPEQAVARYLAAAREAAANPGAALLEVQIDARLPRLHQQGRLRALQSISRLGRVCYRSLGFEGDRAIQKNVIARYLAAEAEARAGGADSLAVTPANYRFRFLRLADYNGAPAYVFRLEPKQKRVGLFRGELWLDAAAFLPLREWGELVKSPSLFVKRVCFVRDYIIVNGCPLPRRTIADVDTRLAGTAELTIWFHLRCATVERYPTILGQRDVELSSSGVGPDACTL